MLNKLTQLTNKHMLEIYPLDMQNTLHNKYVYNIITETYQWNLECDDFSNKEALKLNLYLSNYYLILKNSRPVFLFTITEINPIAAYIHIHKVPDYKGLISKMFLFQLEEYLLKNTTVQTLIAQIPSYRPSVIKFIKRLGFIELGEIPNFTVKNNNLVDSHIAYKNIR